MVSYYVPMVTSLHLSHLLGIIREDGKVSLRLCSECRHSLDEALLPFLALANNFYSGRHLASHLHPLRYLETVVLSRVRWSCLVIKLSGSSKLPGQKAYKGNVLATPQNPDPLLSSTMPRPVGDLANFLHVILVRAIKDVESFTAELFKRIFKVRRGRWR